MISITCCGGASSVLQLRCYWTSRPPRRGVGKTPEEVTVNGLPPAGGGGGGGVGVALKSH